MRPVHKADNLTTFAVVMKSGNLNFLEPSGPLQACNGNALPFFFTPFRKVNISRRFGGERVGDCHLTCAWFCQYCQRNFPAPDGRSGSIMVSHVDYFWRGMLLPCSVKNDCDGLKCLLTCRPAVCVVLLVGHITVSAVACNFKLFVFLCCTANPTAWDTIDARAGTVTAGCLLSLNISANTAATTGTALFWEITQRVVVILYRMDR